MVKKVHTFKLDDPAWLKIGRGVAVGLAGWPQSYQSPTVDDIPTPKSVDGSADVKFGTSMIPRGSGGDMASGAASMPSMIDRGVKAANSNMAIVIHWTKDNDGNYLWWADLLSKANNYERNTIKLESIAKAEINMQYKYYNMNLLKEFYLPSPFSNQPIPNYLIY